MIKKLYNTKNSSEYLWNLVSAYKFWIIIILLLNYFITSSKL